MDDRRGWTYLRNITAVLSLVNVLSVYVERTIAGSASVGAMLRDPNVRIRFWATAILLMIIGIVTLLHLVFSTRDMATDLNPEARGQRLTGLYFGMGQLTVAAGLAVLLLVSH